MGANQNCSQELGIYPKSNPTTLSSNSVQDHLAIDKLSAFRTGSGITTETQNGASKNTCETSGENRTKIQFESAYAFHRTPCGCVQETSSWEQLRLRTSSFLVRQLRTRPASTCNDSQAIENMKIDELDTVCCCPRAL
jgi:hypothetical protein